MDLRQIEYIIAIEQEESISKAAEKLFITQSALNQQLLKLEKELESIDTLRKIDIFDFDSIHNEYLLEKTWFYR